MRIAAILLLGLAAFAAAAQQPERLWVADRLYLGVYSEPDNGGQRLMLLPSGEQVTVLERRGDDLRVRTANGTEGWVREAFMTAEMPANARVRELTPRITTLENENAALRRSAAEAANRPDPEPRVVREADPRTQRELEAAQARLAEVAAELANARAEAARPREPFWHTAWPWLTGAAALLMLVGFAAGLLVLDWWSRRRHGGFRLW